MCLIINYCVAFFVLQNYLRVPENVVIVSQTANRLIHFLTVYNVVQYCTFPIHIDASFNFSEYSV